MAGQLTSDSSIQLIHIRFKYSTNLSDATISIEIHLKRIGTDWPFLMRFESVSLLTFCVRLTSGRDMVNLQFRRTRIKVMQKPNK